MRKWGPAVLIAVALAGMLLWSQCGAPPPGPGYAASDALDLWPVAERHIGELPQDAPWFRERLSTLDLENLGPKAQAMLDMCGAPEDFGRSVDDMGLKQIQWEIDKREPGTTTPLLTHLKGRIAIGRALLARGDKVKGYASLQLALDESAKCVATPRTVAQWEEAHTARLFVLEAVTNCLNAEGRSAAASLFKSLPSAEHRSGLGSALVFNFRDVVVPRVAEASKLERASVAAGFALFAEQEDREEKQQLVAAMLQGHPRAFSPELTVEAGAESVRALRDAMGGPWAGTRGVLDQVRETQKFWDDFDALLTLDQAQAIEKAKALGERARSLENPVGLALLHDERRSWSGMVQSAYVADAKEAVFRYALSRAAGVDELAVTDPLTGKALHVVDDKALFSSEGDDVYPFIEGLARTPLAAVLRS